MELPLAEHVDRYLASLFVPTDEGLDAALRASEAAGLPPIHVAPVQGKLLHLLATMLRAQRILEIGTLGGYSAIWMARALPPTGKLVTLELDPKHAAVAKSNLARAGLADLAEIRVGDALALLKQIAVSESDRFDLVFIDADKARTPEYFTESLRMTRIGGAIVIDNAIRRGNVVEEKSTDPGVNGLRRVMEMMSTDPRVTASALQTVGAKGHDGFAIAVVTGV